MTFNLDNLATVLRARGLKVVESPGWINRGYAGQDLQAVRGVLWHHTATNRAAFNSSNAPTLSLCINGRSDLPGPLANIVFGRDGTCYIVATGVANHAGTGRAPGIPVNMGNHYLIGIEMESSGIAPWDWTAEMLREAPKLGAALELAYLQGIPEPERLQIAHFEYSDAGKIDPAGWPGGMDGLRQSINNQIAAWSGGTTPQADTIAPKEDTLSAAEVNTILNAIGDKATEVKKYVADLLIYEYQTGGKVHPGIGRVVEENQRRVNTANAKLAALETIVGQLAKNQGVAIDYKKIDASIQKALAGGIEITGAIVAKDGAK